MKKSLLILSILVSNITFSYSQDDSKDYEIKYGSPKIYHATQDVIDEINSNESLRSKRIVLAKTTTQKDFDKVCESLSWVNKLEVASNNPNITNIEAIKNLKLLEEFSLKGIKSSNETPIDLKPLGTLTSLKKLDFYATKVTNTEALGSLTNLESVSFYMSSVSSISFISNTPNIKQLSLYGPGHTFENYEPVAQLRKLEDLDIYMNKQATDANLAVLSSLTSLKVISMSNCMQVTSLDFLVNNKQMEKIWASWDSEIVNISALGKMEQIKVLKISKSKVKSLDILKGKTSLTSIDVSATNITDITPLKDCINLSDVNISKTGISDISPLFGYENIRYLKVSSKVPAEQIEKIKTLFPKIRISVKD